MSPIIEIDNHSITKFSYRLLLIKKKNRMMLLMQHINNDNIVMLFITSKQY